MNSSDCVTDKLISCIPVWAAPGREAESSKIYKWPNYQIQLGRLTQTDIFQLPSSWDITY